MQSLTVSQLGQLNQWIEQVRFHEQGALKWAKALWEIHRSGFWKAQTESWAAFCRDTFGYSKSRAYEYVNAINFIENQKLLAEHNPDIEVPASLSAVKRVKVEKRARTVRLTPVKSLTVETHPIIPAKPGAAPIDLRCLLAAMDKEFGALIHRQDIPFEALRIIHHLSSELQQARHMLQGVLPGFEDVASKPKFKKPTLDEVQLFCAKAGICANDAEWFWNKMEGNGWKNGGEPVKDWGRTLLAWKLAGHLPSQKHFTANGAQVPKPKTIVQNDIERMQRDIARV